MRALSQSFLFLVFLAVVSCGEKESGSPVPAPKSRILDAYARIDLGMTQSEVEKVAGEPVLPLTEGAPGKNEEVAWYIDTPERDLEAHESPWGLAGIKVTFRDGKVVEKKYNFQWVPRELREEFESKSGN